MASLKVVKLTPLEEKKYLNLREVAELYNLSLGSLRQWASQRRFPLYKVSNRIKVRAKEFEEWFEKHYVKPYEKKSDYERPFGGYGPNLEKGPIRR